MLRWFGYVEKRFVDSMIKRICKMEKSQQIKVEKKIKKLLRNILRLII